MQADNPRLRRPVGRVAGGEREYREYQKGYDRKNPEPVFHIYPHAARSGC
jgi:hypothetical protein